MFLFSCSDASQENTIDDDSPTLRYTANALYEATLWTEEIEVDRLTSKVSSVPGISSRLNLSPLIIIASEPGESSEIFPHLASFGSLDTRLISNSLRETLTSFSKTIAKNEAADSFMSKECLYSLALFYEDFNRIFADCFELNKIQEIPKTDISEDEKQIEEKIYFSSFVFGQPFLDGIYYEIPIKFFSEKATLTLCVFCFEEAGSWKIDQIQISDWEILNGKK